MIILMHPIVLAQHQICQIHEQQISAVVCAYELYPVKKKEREREKREKCVMRNFKYRHYALISDLNIHKSKTIAQLHSNDNKLK